MEGRSSPRFPRQGSTPGTDVPGILFVQKHTYTLPAESRRGSLCGCLMLVQHLAVILGGWGVSGRGAAPRQAPRGPVSAAPRLLPTAPGAPSREQEGPRPGACVSPPQSRAPSSPVQRGSQGSVSPSGTRRRTPARSARHSQEQAADRRPAGAKGPPAAGAFARPATAARLLPLAMASRKPPGLWAPRGCYAAGPYAGSGEEEGRRERGGSRGGNSASQDRGAHRTVLPRRNFRPSAASTVDVLAYDRMKAGHREKAKFGCPQPRLPGFFRRRGSLWFEW